MLQLKKLFGWRYNPHAPADENNRKYQLIHTITFELLVLGIILAYINIYLQFWLISYLLFSGIVITVLNLILLRKNYNLSLCGHIINILCLSMMTLGNLWLGGLSSSYLGWFYLSPIIASATIGLDGLVIYSLLSASLMLIFISGYFTSLYIIPQNYLHVLNNINHIFIFLLIFTILYNLLIANKHYDALLKEQNFLLYSDKQKFHYLSHHDSLTNLPNRSYFHQHLQTLMDAIDVTENSITLYFMDLDGFKKINDKYGHEVGDILLLQTSKRLQSCFRKNDFIARLGGDEFTAVITHNLKDKIAQTLSRRIEKEFQEPFLINGLEIKCTISIGRANYPGNALQAESLLKLADEAMYRNKKLKYTLNKQG